MGYEVDFLAVGDESKSGDAISLRFGDLNGKRENQTIVVIDGGFTKSGEELASLISKHYGSQLVDLVISTHPDADHINGLNEIIDRLHVKELWIHKPWEHIEGIADKFMDGRVTDESIGKRLKESLEIAYQLCVKAEKKDIIIKEPFTGLIDESGCIKVLGPTETYYEELLTGFEGMPEKIEESLSFTEAMKKAAEVVKKMIKEFWSIDSITDDGITSAKNNSCVITQFIYDGRKSFFSADSGIQSLDYAIDYMNTYADNSKLALVQIPHHGSQRNIGPNVLNKLIGKPVLEGTKPFFTAIASGAKNGEPKHPNKKVLNAFTRRGAKTLVTKGSSICHSNNAPDREGYSPSTPLPFYSEVEE